ncbi:uncharacterized protein [Pyxicephalus adspersus]|uniref:uncharacterized protein isoform X2 n=1 Tax=Pyxicephalus adspersus TaxID=30357 RepID=UPI003B5B6CF8
MYVRTTLLNHCTEQTTKNYRTPNSITNLYDDYGGRLSRKENRFIYHFNERDSGCPSCSGYYEDELKNEFDQSEMRRSALHQSLRNAHNALQHQMDCLQLQENNIANSDVTLEHLLQRQELLESRFSYFKRNNFCPGFVSQDVSGIKEQGFHYTPGITNSSRITNLEGEINDIKIKLRRYSLLKENESHKLNLTEERKNEEAEHVEMQEELRQHVECMETKCNNVQRERDALELEMASLLSGLHQAKVDSKELEKKCVKLQSQVMANRNINESLHLEVSALKKHSHTLENAVKGSENENKSLHSQIDDLQQENQSLISQKEFLFSIMKKKPKRKHQCKEQTKREEKGMYVSPQQDIVAECISHTPIKSATKQMQIHKQEDTSCVNPTESTLLSGSSCASSARNSRRSRKLRRKKEVKFESKDDGSKHGDEHQMDCKSKISELNTGIVLACYQHLADLLRKLECLCKSNVKLDQEKEHIFTFLLGTLKELKDTKVSSDKSREQVEELLNEQNDLYENYHLRLNQDSLKLLKLHDQATGSM